MSTIPWVAIFTPLWIYFLVLLGTVAYLVNSKREFLHHALQNLPEEPYPMNKRLLFLQFFH